MKKFKLFAFMFAMAFAMSATAQQVKVLGKSGSTSTGTTKKAATPKTKSVSKTSSSSYGSDFSIEGWQGSAGINYQIADNFNAFGLYARIMYGLNEEMRLSLSDEFYFKDGLSLLDNIDFDFHYLFNVAENIHVYPLGGATIQLVKTKSEKIDVSADDIAAAAAYGIAIPTEVGGESTSAFGLNFGCGVQYAITDQIGICAEAKYRFYFKDNYKGQFVLGAGVIYKF